MTPPPARNAPPLAAVLAAAAAAWQHLVAGRAIDTAISQALQAPPGAAQAVPAAALRAPVVDVVFTAARERALLAALLARFAERAPAAPVAALLTVALSQLRAGRHGDFTVVDQAVAAARADPATVRAAGFVNALLRRYGREGTAAVAEARQDPLVRANVPAWWLARLQAEWPDHWSDILAVQTGTPGPPPQVLRVNRRQGDPAGYVARLAAEGLAAFRVGRDAVCIRQPLPVEALPGFTDGLVSVQDAGSQLAVDLLDLRDGQRVLDACAAPGGKTLHLVERADVTVDAVERDAQRARRIHENLARIAAGDRALAARVRVLVADATDPRSLRAALAAAVEASAASVPAAADDGAGTGAQLYDRIVLDAPCTASGIVRRHPDIPWLRRPGDVANLATTQRRLLDGLWPLLAPAGRLLYVVCSLFAEEGVDQVHGFLHRHPDARLVPLPGLSVDMLRLLPTALPRSLQASPRAPHEPRGPHAMTAADPGVAGVHLPGPQGHGPGPSEPGSNAAVLSDPWSDPATSALSVPGLSFLASSSAALPATPLSAAAAATLPLVHDGFFYALLAKTAPPPA